MLASCIPFIIRILNVNSWLGMLKPFTMVIAILKSIVILINVTT